MDVSRVGPDGKVDDMLPLGSDERPQLPVPGAGKSEVRHGTRIDSGNPCCARSQRRGGGGGRDILPAHAGAETPARLRQNEVFSRGVTVRKHSCQRPEDEAGGGGGGGIAHSYVSCETAMVPVSWRDG